VTPLGRIGATFRPEVGRLLLGTALLAVSAGASVAGPILVAHALDVDVGNRDPHGLAIRTGLYVATVVIGLVASLGSRIALEIAAQGAMRRLKLALFEHLVDHDVAVHDALPSGSLIGRVQGDVEALRVLFVEVVLALPGDVVLMAGILVVLLVQAREIALPVLLVGPAWLALFGLFRWIAPPFFVRQRERVSELTGALAETVRSFPAMRALGRHRWAGDRVAALVRRARSADVLAHLQPIWYFNGAQTIRGVATTAVLVWGAILVARGQATVGLLVLGVTYLRQLFQPLMRLSNQLATLERARASAVRVTGLLETARTVVDPPSPAPWPGLRRELRIEAVSFAYAPGTPVLQEVDLVVPAGARIGVVGATGSGKSTLVDLVLRFRDPDQGRITVDGVDLRALRLAEIRARTALVLQEVRLLPGTVLDNLGGDAVAARRALDAIGLDVPLDRPVDEATLSRGERQLLTFARSLVGDPELLVLDEATSAIDPTTEHRVQEGLDRLMRGRTVVIVAHRLDTVRTCDRICVMHRGRLAEVGTHDELVSRGGIYATLVRTQEAA
jgi:ABC-type multidrug transport system fused ATPase/permease subunit